jgi:Sec7-like guanine-nucleotide exchange factor
MIDQKTWGNFLFALWKMIKKYQTVEDFSKLMDDADAIMNEFPEPIFRVLVLGFIEQKNIESIRGTVPR